MKLTQLTPSPELARRLHQGAVKDPRWNANQLPQKCTTVHSKNTRYFRIKKKKKRANQSDTP